MDNPVLIEWFSGLSWAVLAGLAAVVGAFVAFLVAVVVRLPMVDGSWQSDRKDSWIECPNCHRDNPANMHSCLHCHFVLHQHLAHSGA